MNPYRKHTGTCRSCKAEIIWAVSPAGKTLPLDARSTDILDLAGITLPRPLYVVEEIPDGPDAGKLQASVTDRDGPGFAAGYTYVSHFATCPTRAQHSSKGKGR